MKSADSKQAPDPAQVAEARLAYASGEAARLRQEARLSRREMAAWLGCSQDALRNWEKGDTWPRARHAAAIVDLLRKLRALCGTAA